MVALLLPASGAGVAGAGGGVIAGGVGVVGAGVALESVAGGGVAGASSRLLQPARRAVNMTEAKTAWRTNINASKSCLNKNGYGKV